MNMENMIPISDVIKI